MVVNWKSSETYRRLFTALLAANNNTINVHEVVRLFGEPMTRDALENRLRVLKRDAKEMKAQADGEDATAPNTPAKGDSSVEASTTPRNCRKKKETMVTPNNSVKTGRVTKTKKPKAPKIKKEGRKYTSSEEEAFDDKVARGYVSPEGGDEFDDFV